jgi:predicted nucleic acid-binding protein
VIVVDTNVIVYAVIPGTRTAQALELAEHDPIWIAPAVWRRELRNVLATLMRARALPLAMALAAFRAAEQLVADATVEPTTEQCLRWAAKRGISAWDAEFAFAAQALGLPLVTADKRLARAIGRQAVLLGDSAP